MTTQYSPLNPRYDGPIKYENVINATNSVTEKYCLALVASMGLSVTRHPPYQYYHVDRCAGMIHSGGWREQGTAAVAFCMRNYLPIE